MADQEFLASFGVEMDESGAARLQAALALGLFLFAFMVIVLYYTQEKIIK